MTVPAELVQAVRLPEVLVPKAVREAAQLREERHADYQAAVRRRQEAELALQGAVQADMEQTAAARDAGREDPPPEHEQAARARLTEAERNQAVEELRLQRAHQALQDALQDGAQGWLSAVQAARPKADAKAQRALDQVRAAEVERQALAGAAVWLQALLEGSDLGRALRKGAGLGPTGVADARSTGRAMSAEELLDAMGVYLADSSLEGLQAAQAEREAQEAEADRRREQLRQAQQAVPGRGS
jgi:hypothetical protein